MNQNSSIPPSPLNTAVLFLVFNRLDTTKQVFRAIREAKPPRLYIASDGARETKEGESDKVNEVREYLISNIDWDCEVNTLFRDNNLGCKYAVSGAIDWFFKNEEMGIILEDDCLPSQSFFWFCEELLEKYRDEHRVSSISGSNPFKYADNINGEEESYFFSKYNRIWGWASWRRAWSHYDVHMRVWPEAKKRKSHYVFFESKAERESMENIYQQCYEGKIDTWDFQWSFTKSLMMSVTLVSKKNLIKNIGEGVDATHTHHLPKEISDSRLENVSFPLKHPKEIIIDYNKDLHTMKYRFDKFGILKYVKEIIKKV
ncbi:hypothetical protein [Vibrio gazogenes]